MKTEFELNVLETQYNAYLGSVKIIGTNTKTTKPYIKFEIEGKYVGGNKRTSACIKDEDMERFAVNILKALKSKRLKP